MYQKICGKRRGTPSPPLVLIVYKEAFVDLFSYAEEIFAVPVAREGERIIDDGFDLSRVL